MADSEFDDSDVEEIDLFPNTTVETNNDTNNALGEAEDERKRPDIIFDDVLLYSESSNGHVKGKGDFIYFGSKLTESTGAEEKSIEPSPNENEGCVSSETNHEKEDCTSSLQKIDPINSTIKICKPEDNGIHQGEEIPFATEVQETNVEIEKDKPTGTTINHPLLQDDNKVLPKNEALVNHGAMLEIKVQKVNDEEKENVIHSGQSNVISENVIITENGRKDIHTISHKRTSEVSSSEEGTTKRQKSLDGTHTTVTETCESVSNGPSTKIQSDMKDKEMNVKKNVVCKNGPEKDKSQEHANNSECPPIAIVSPHGEEKQTSVKDSSDWWNTYNEINEARGTSNKVNYDSQTSLDEFSVDEMVKSIFGAEKSDTFQTLDGNNWIFPDLEDFTGSKKKHSFESSLDIEKTIKNVETEFEIAPEDIQAIIKQEISTEFDENASALGNAEIVSGENDAANVSKERYPPYSVSTERITPPPPEPVMKTSTFGGFLKQGPPNRIAPNIDNVPCSKANDYSVLINLLQAVQKAQHQNKSLESPPSVSVASNTESNTYTTTHTISSTQSVSAINTDITHTILSKPLPDTTHTILSKSPPDITHSILSKSPPDITHSILSKPPPDTTHSVLPKPPPLSGPYNQPNMHPRQPHLNQVRPENPANRNQAFSVNNVQQHQRSSSVGSTDSGYTSPVRSTTPVSLPHYPNNLPQQYHHQQPYLEGNLNKLTVHNPYQTDKQFITPNHSRRNSLPHTSYMLDSSGMTFNQSLNRSQLNMTESQGATQNFNVSSVGTSDSVTNAQASWNNEYSREHSMQPPHMQVPQGMPQYGTQRNQFQYSNQEQHVPQLASNTLSLSDIQRLTSNMDEQQNNTFNSYISSPCGNTQKRSKQTPLWNSSHADNDQSQKLNKTVHTIRQKLSAVMALASRNATPLVKLLAGQFVNKLKIAKQSNLSEVEKHQLIADTKKFISDITHLCNTSVCQQQSSLMPRMASNLVPSGTGVGTYSSGNLSGCGNSGFVSSVSLVSINPYPSGYTSVDRYPKMSAPSTYENGGTYQSVLTKNVISLHANDNVQNASSLPSSNSSQYPQGNQFSYQSGNNNRVISKYRNLNNQYLLNNSNQFTNVHGGSQLVSNNIVTENVFNQIKPPNVMSFDKSVNSVRPDLSGQSGNQRMLTLSNYQRSISGPTSISGSNTNISGNFLPQATNQMVQSQIAGNDCFITGATSLNNTQYTTLMADNVTELDASNPFDDINPLERFIS